jgi:hypothetical protein
VITPDDVSDENKIGLWVLNRAEELQKRGIIRWNGETLTPIGIHILDQMVGFQPEDIDICNCLEYLGVDKRSWNFWLMSLYEIDKRCFDYDRRHRST